jgi:hypothetical protein
LKENRERFRITGFQGKREMSPPEPWKAGIIAKGMIVIWNYLFGCGGEKMGPGGMRS